MHLFRVFTDLRLQRPFEEHSACNMAGYSAVVLYGYTLALGQAGLCRLGWEASMIPGHVGVRALG